MKYDLKKMYGSLELIVNICVLEKMRTAAVISIEAFLAQLCRVFFLPHIICPY